MDLYLMWVAGMGRPKKIHETIEGAREAAKAYKSGGGTRECHIFKSVEVIEGRKLLSLKRRTNGEVEPKVDDTHK